MKIAADTNLLVRIVTRDDLAQAEIAYGLLSSAEVVVVSLPCLCEFVWVLRAVYGFKTDQLDAAVRSVVDPGNVVTDRTTVDAGLRMQAAGGDFSDGVIARVGIAMGAEMFVSFDRKAVVRLSGMGVSAHHAGEFR